mmetsp:Transcript_74207/g.170030  ORF Transcript_74207/g.170030 Transcript_74207/m.170030 type:complete len:121 (+) Transcript_74207:39-401(+)|eukprot:CAMPEP_0204313510 /NCGR_PEP_ID=MMETSP0469-20131031/3642_1 /ASSEMBLY_ACC=CAM_ASM_000384 /TAXON_ID=2969 /ORGANISM="Oxyrrhis marina" /LENGTH=120 /DNA_ID=CAMNT_0051293819 /DNA_START=39 /DNA_END=401 /DNA_ORIENTATION=+
MSSKPISELSEAAIGELCCTYAALILQDGEGEITGDALAKVVKAAGGKLDAHFPALFAKAMQGKDLAKMLKTLGKPGAGGGGGAAPAAAAAGGGAAPAAAAAAAVEEEEEEEGMDFDLFG